MKKPRSRPPPEQAPHVLRLRGLQRSTSSGGGGHTGAHGGSKSDAHPPREMAPQPDQAPLSVGSASPSAHGLRGRDTAAEARGPVLFVTQPRVKARRRDVSALIQADRRPHLAQEITEQRAHESSDDTFHMTCPCPKPLGPAQAWAPLGPLFPCQV